MNKKTLIALADAIRDHNTTYASGHRGRLNNIHIEMLADFCASQNPSFKRERWEDYIAGRCGANGGTK
jgi:hypothetical protein